MNSSPLNDAVLKGLRYLAGQQHADGGWSQGGGWRSAAGGGRVEGVDVKDPADVANTCVATLAMWRAGNTPTTGEFAGHVLRGLDFVINHVERADVDSPFVTDLRDTQVQVKIGPYVDTFLCALVLAEVKGSMPDAESEQRLAAALDKVVHKMQTHQRADGTWDMRGCWAPIVGHALAAAGLNRAQQKGAAVADESLERSEQFSQAQFDAGSKSFSGEGSAGVPLYSTASHLSARQHSMNSYKTLKMKWRRVLDDERSSDAEKEIARDKLKYMDSAESSHEDSLSSSYASFRNKNFVEGFGCNGGEEFLSYLNISETLFIKGGTEWEEWNKGVTKNLASVQHADGSWTGHHCITGRTFCTAAALLVMLADRAPRPEPAHT